MPPQADIPQTVSTGSSAFGRPAPTKSQQGESTGGLTRQWSIRGRNLHGVVSSSLRPENWRTTSPRRSGISTFQIPPTSSIGRTPTRCAGRYLRLSMPSGKNGVLQGDAVLPEEERAGRRTVHDEQACAGTVGTVV